MIVMSSVVLFFSIYLEGILTTFSSSLSSNFMLLTLLMIYPLYMRQKKIYLLFLFLATIMYDLLYTNILFLHTILLFCIYLSMEKNTKRLDLSVVIGYFFLYHFLLFSCFYLCGVVQNPIFLFQNLLYSSLPNILYVFFLYAIFHKYYQKHTLRIFS